MQKIFLIRHGETIYNTKKKYCGFSDPDLTARGKEQSKRLARRLCNEGIRIIYSSDLKRAHKTADIVFGREAVKTSDLRELNFGKWDGMTYEEICSSSYKDQYSRWLGDPLSVSPPEGESLIMLEKRVIEFFQPETLKHKNEKIAFVTHGGPIRVILCNILGKGLSGFWNIDVHQGSVTYFDYIDGRAENIVLNETLGA